MSEFFEEYTHIVADLKPWDYFDIPSCLKRLSWSVAECYHRITPQWLDNSLLSRHAVVQLALYTCSPFYDVPPARYPLSSATEGYIVDQYHQKNMDKKQRQYLCLSVLSLIETLATALMHYERWCEFHYEWPKFQEQRKRSIAFLRGVQDLKSALGRGGYRWENPTLKHRRTINDRIEEVITIIEAISYHDYQRSGAATNTPRHPRTHGNKFYLLSEMENAFTTYMSPTWSQVGTYRALASIMNQMQITNANGKTWSAGAIKRFLARGPDPRLRFTIRLTTPTIKSWYTRPE